MLPGFDNRVRNLCATHTYIMGREDGNRLSTWSEIYPPALCNALLDACCDNS